jgi:hypothetical protein
VVEPGAVGNRQGFGCLPGIIRSADRRRHSR